MPILDARERLAFPGGDNSSDTLIGGVHFNLTTLRDWNYTLYSNGTLSNGSWCLLTFAPYTPSFVFPNGSFVNVTWCWSPVNNIGPRAGIAIGYAVAFGLALVLTLFNLNKHGRLHLPVQKRFFPIGRRWQWYWASWVCATALISLLTNVDVDRYYVPELPIVLTSFFWFLMQMGTMALVWEAVRHWGSWMERQYIDPDPFVLRDDDRRSKIEFWLPLWFYLCLWLNFFMIVPRNWGPIELQRYPQQTIDEATPTATDARFKAAAFFLVVCWLTTVFSLRHSIRHYCPRNRGFFNRAAGFVRYTPLRFLLIIPLAVVIPAYQALVAWDFAYSPLKVDGNKAAIFAGGYTPTLLILYIQAIFGFFNPNEDLELLRQRRVRAQELDRDMGIVHKPSWWRGVNGEHIDPNESMRDRLARNVRELHGDRPTALSPETGIPIPLAEAPSEVGMMSPASPAAPTAPHVVASAHTQPYVGKSDRRRQERAMELAAGLLFPEAGEQATAAAAAAARRRDELTGDDGPPQQPPPPYRETEGHSPASHVARSVTAQSTGSTNQPPQQIRSMLDV